MPRTRPGLWIKGELLPDEPDFTSRDEDPAYLGALSDKYANLVDRMRALMASDPDQRAAIVIQRAAIRKWDTIKLFIQLSRKYNPWTRQQLLSWSSGNDERVEASMRESLRGARDITRGIRGYIYRGVMLDWDTVVKDGPLDDVMLTSWTINPMFACKWARGRCGPCFSDNPRLRYTVLRMRIDSPGKKFFIGTWFSDVLNDDKHELIADARYRKSTSKLTSYHEQAEVVVEPCKRIVRTLKIVEETVLTGVLDDGAYLKNQNRDPKALRTSGFFSQCPTSMYGSSRTTRLLLVDVTPLAPEPDMTWTRRKRLRTEEGIKAFSRQ
jgi:hypothetical protein